MDFDDISRVCNKFSDLLQFSSETFSIDCVESSECCELQINANKVLKCSILVYNGSLSILYNTTFEEDSLYTLNFTSTISLLYYLSIIYYSQTNVNLNEDEEFVDSSLRCDYLSLLTILLEDGIDNWRSLFKTLCHAVQLHVDEVDNDFEVEGHSVTYYDHILSCDSINIAIDEHYLSKFCEAIFNIVEYIATLVGTQDLLYEEVPEEPVFMPEMEDEEDNVFGGGGDFTFDEGDDFDIDFEEESEPVGNESPSDLSPDFSVPDGVEE